MTDLLVIANGRLGKGLARARWQRALDRLRELFGNGVEIYFTKGRGDATRRAREALLAGVGWLAAAGGDGTFHEVVNGYFDRGRNIQPKSALSFFPCGSANDWTRTLGVPGSLLASVEALTNSTIHKVDVSLARYQGLSGAAEERVFINVAEAGIGAEVVRRWLSRFRILRSRTAYLLTAVSASLSYVPKRLQLVFDGQTAVATEPLLVLIVAGGRYFGAGIHCAPMAAVDDGLLEVITLGNFSTREIPRQLSNFIRGEYFDHPKVTHRSAKSIEASAGEKVFLELDGELVGSLPFTISILPQALWTRY